MSIEREQLEKTTEWCTWKCKLPRGHQGPHELCLPFDKPEWLSAAPAQPVAEARMLKSKAEDWLNEHKHTWSAHDLFSLIRLLEFAAVSPAGQGQPHAAFWRTKFVEQFRRDLIAGLTPWSSEAVYVRTGSLNVHEQWLKRDDVLAALDAAQEQVSGSTGANK